MANRLHSRRGAARLRCNWSQLGSARLGSAPPDCQLGRNGRVHAFSAPRSTLARQHNLAASLWVELAPSSAGGCNKLACARKLTLGRLSSWLAGWLMQSPRAVYQRVNFHRESLSSAQQQQQQQQQQLVPLECSAKSRQGEAKAEGRREGGGGGSIWLSLRDTCQRKSGSRLVICSAGGAAN